MRRMMMRRMMKELNSEDIILSQSKEDGIDHEKK